MLTPEQTEDLTKLQAIAGQHGAEIVVIGAAALLCFVDLKRFTRDVDLAVSLDLDGFAAFSTELAAHGWMQEPRMEHRWRGARGSIIDLMPAGPDLRAAKQVTWPESRFVMSLVGFDQAFAHSVQIEIAPGVSIRVAPAAVIGLLKMVACLEAPYERQKDLEDLKLLLRSYEKDSERIFSDEVLDAELEDVGDANALLLGMDVGTIVADDANVVRRFLESNKIPSAERAELDPEDPHQREILRFQSALKAFEIGFEMARRGRAWL